MDPRKQKRLGPAPIASFEKSFDDNTATHYPNSNSIGGGLSAISRLPSNGFDEEIMDSSDVCADDGKDSSFHIHKGGNVGDDESMTNLNKDTQKQRQQQQQQQQQPIISVSQTGTKKLYEIGGKRLPPLKTANASLNSTTGSGDPMTPIKNATTLQTPSTPRIELSRASSSSYHEEDSRESSPENVFEQVGTGTLQETIGLGFREEGALELRSSTEELFFMDPEQKKEEQEKLQQQQTRRSSPLIFRFDDPQNYLQQHQRKDSASSEVAALLCISGRTSRVSSVGSQGSAVSRLSAISGVSRSPSPHRMLLETSFCGPKPLENVVDGRVVSTVEPPTAEALEQVLLARKQDPTQAVLAEGIKIESSPKRKSKTERLLPNGESSKEIERRNESKSRQSRSIAAEISSISSGSSPSAKATMGNTRTSTKSPGQMVIGKTASGTEYIRINLKPDHMYNDKGIAANERVVEAPNSLAPVTSKASHRKPISLSLGRTMPPIEDGNRLTPSSSPKPSRHVALTKETIAGSRSPSPANAIASRKSSFSSLFKVKDSPDSPRERSRSRSKSKDHITVTPQSQSATPSKQKSVLAIFRPKRGSGAGVEAKSKSSSPIDGTDQQMMRSKSNTPQESSRPNSRLRYYEAPQDDKGIHIPLHTPPDEKEARKGIPGVEKLAAEPSIRPHSAPITASQLMAAAAALKPVSASTRTANAHVPVRPLLLNRATQRIENLDAIHTLSSDNSDEKELNWSLEVNRHSSQDSQGTIGSEASFPNNVKTSVRTNLTNVKESPVRENGIAAAAEIHRWPPTSQASLERTADESAAQVKNHPPQTGDAIAKEKRRLLFATRIGSGSQEQIFSTQFSLSKTESLTSQLSEQTSIPESPSAGQEQLQRQDTVLRRPDDLMAAAGVAAAAAARARGSEDRSCLSGSSSTSYQVRKTDANLQRTKSSSTSDEDKAQQHHPVLLRKKDPNEESRRKSRSTSEDDDGIATAHHRHSRYLENFDVRKKFHENISRKGLRQNSDFAGAKDRERINEVDPQPLAINHEENAITSAPAFSTKKPTLPQTPPPSSSTTSPPPPPPPMKPPPSKQSSDERALQESPSIQSPLNRPVKPPRTSIPVSASPTPPPPQPPSASSLASPRHHHHSLSKHPDRQSNLSTDEPIESSESERDSDLASVASGDPSRRHLPRHVGVIEDHESTGLVSQDSFDDELPYIPTTLPEERAHGVSLIPVKERVHMELKTCPLDRPRSTTPMNPSHLEEYCTEQQQQHLQQSDHRPDHPIGVGSGLVRGEKLRISLPRKDSIKEKAQKTKSPRRVSNASGKSWFEFAEEGLRGSPLAATTTIDRKETTNETESLPSSTMLRKTSDQWIDFDSIPEKRKAPKRITALPKDATTRLHQQKQPDVTIPVAGTMKHQPQYNYVKPEDCQCECHEVERESSANAAARKPIANVDLLQQGEDLEPLLDPETNDGIDPSDSSREYSYYTDDEADMPRRQRKYSRTKSGGQYKNDEFPLRDGIQSPRNKKFPDNRC